jgi:hypothetical protein
MRFLAPFPATQCRYLPWGEALTQEIFAALGAGGRTFKSCRPDQAQAFSLHVPREEPKTDNRKL